MAQDHQINLDQANRGPRPESGPAATPEPGVEFRQPTSGGIGTQREGLRKTTDERVVGEARMVQGRSESSSPAQTQEGMDNGGGAIAVMRADIARTRQETAQTIDAIHHRLSPGALTAQAREKIKEATVDKAKAFANSATDLAKDTGGIMFDAIKDNIIPTVLITGGIAWLIKSNKETRSRDGRRPRGYPPHVYPEFDEWRHAPDDQFRAIQDEPGAERGGDGRRRSSTEEVKDRVQGAGDRVSIAAGQAKDRASEAASDMKDRMGHATHRMGKKASEIGEQSMHQYRRVRRGFFDTLHENPLALAGAALAVGTLFGIAIPESEHERDWMGETRDDIMWEAKKKGKEVVEKAEHVVEHAAESAAEGAEAEAKRQNLAT